MLVDGLCFLTSKLFSTTCVKNNFTKTLNMHNIYQKFKEKRFIMNQLIDLDHQNTNADEQNFPNSFNGIAMSF